MIANMPYCNYKLTVQVTYLDVGNFCDKSTETSLHKICVQVFLRFSDTSKPSQPVSLVSELVWLAGIRKSDKNLLKTLCKVAPVTKVAHIFWWRHDNRKQSASAREHWCDVTFNIPYSGRNGKWFLYNRVWYCMFWFLYNRVWYCMFIFYLILWTNFKEFL